MMATVEFYNNPRLEANKINDIWTQWLLPPKLVSPNPPLAKTRPQEPLGIGQIFPERSRTFPVHLYSPTPSPPPYPSP